LADPCEKVAESGEYPVLITILSDEKFNTFCQGKDALKIFFYKKVVAFQPNMIWGKIPSNSTVDNWQKFRPQKTQKLTAQQSLRPEEPAADDSAAPQRERPEQEREKV
jgi:phosphorylcholine metabolism protein LicD